MTADSSGVVDIPHVLANADFLVPMNISSCVETLPSYSLWPANWENSTADELKLEKLRLAFVKEKS